ncbi:MAG TPA: methylamine utilization protein [bacterium]|nr:methylamine utilization protein [bacterium]
MYKPLILVSVSIISVQIYAGQITGTVEVQGKETSGYAVVYIEKSEGIRVTPPESQPVLDQRDLQFIPHVLPVMVGTTVRFRNSDDVAHNIFTPSPAGDMFNLGTWKGDQVKTHTFDTPGEVMLLCNLHPEMEGYIYIVPTPFFARTDANGHFTIKDVLEGKYTLKVWSEHGNARPRTVNVPAEGKVTADFTIQ